MKILIVMLLTILLTSCINGDCPNKQANDFFDPCKDIHGHVTQITKNVNTGDYYLTCSIDDNQIRNIK